MKTQLQTVCGFAAKRSPLNVINSVRITKDFCYATDGSSSMRIGIDGPDLDVCVDAGILSDVLRGFTDDQSINILKGDNHIVIKGGSRRFKARTVNNLGMPEIEAGGDFHDVDPAAISAALKFCSPAASTRDVAKPMWTNVVVNLTANGTYAVGCDGMRLHAYKMDDIAHQTDVICTIPRPLALRMASLCEIGGQMKINRHRVVYTKGDATFISVLSAMEYPDWKRIVPKAQSYATTATATPKALASVCESATRMGAEFITLRAANGRLEVRADIKGDELHDSIECEVSGPVATSTVRPQYMADAIAAMGVNNELTMHIPDMASNKNIPIFFTNKTPHVCFAMGYRT